MSLVGCIYSRKFLSGICLVGKVSVGDVLGRGNARRAFYWSGKCPSRMCLVGEVSVGDVSGRGSIRRGCVWSRKCLSEKCPSGKSPSEKCPSGDVSGNQFAFIIFNETGKQRQIKCLMGK